MKLSAHAGGSPVVLRRAGLYRRILGKFGGERYVEARLIVRLPLCGVRRWVSRDGRERLKGPSKRDRSELLDRLVAGYRLSDKLLVTARVLGLPCALLQSLDERVRSRSGLSPPSLLVGVRRLLLSKKLSRIPEVHVESLDFFNEH